MLDELGDELDLQELLPARRGHRVAGADGPGHHVMEVDRLRGGLGGLGR